jgi:nicotinate phosphoribosyltransferase
MAGRVPDQLGIALTDCITMDAFLRDLVLSLRALSGVAPRLRRPGGMGRESHRPLRKLGIDPMSKVLVFSDNLDLAKAVDLYRHFNPGEPELRDWHPFNLRYSSG